MAFSSFKPHFNVRKRMMKLLTAFLILLSPSLALAQAQLHIFDGKTLNGWDLNEGIWRVEDGAVTVGSYEKKWPKNEFICTKNNYSNFELNLSIKCDGDPKTGLINSGIQIRSARLPNGRVAGYQVDCGDGWFGKIYDEHRRKLIYPEPLNEATLLKAIDTYGWNDYRILAEGPRIQVWINDIKASDFTETNPNIPLDGFIAPQIHSGGHVMVQFKDISIKELPATEGAPTWKSLGGAQAALKKVKKKKPKKKVTATKGNKPNIILIFTDDQGYEDLGCFGSTKIKTPRLDEMAAEGLKLTNFYAQPVCGVSRAALMTGTYPIRIAEPRNHKHLHTVPHPKEITMAEVLKPAGYHTGIIGKWHLTSKNKNGSFPSETMPNAQGFDYFYGTPLYNGFTVYVEDYSIRVPLFRNEEIVNKGVESWDNITRVYTDEAINYIEKNKDQPFFLYLAHNMPHIPVGASPEFKGKSDYGPYGDTIEEIDWSTGKILDKLKELEIDDDTLVIFTSDNGPWVETTHSMIPDGKPFIPRDHSGSAAPLRGYKMSAWDGGSKVPFIARWPKKIAEGSKSTELLSTLDLLPTFAKLAGVDLPKDRILDGHDSTDFLLGKTKSSPRHDYFYYSGCLLTGVRVDQWKLVLPRPAKPQGTGWWGRLIEKVPETLLFNLDSDPGETTNVAKQHPEIVSNLMAKIEEGRQELGDMNVVGSGARHFDPQPRSIQSLRKKAMPFPAKPVKTK